jgi:putative Mg2+ transporter-C (MgtC) family protein
LQLIGVAEDKSRWKLYPVIYEVRGTNQNRIYLAVLSVMDRAGIRLSVLERESIASLERVVFAVTANRPTHRRLAQELRASDAADEVVAFRDIDDE